MKKISKLMFSILSLLISVSAMVVGVFAYVSAASVTVSSTIAYTAKDVFVQAIGYIDNGDFSQNQHFGKYYYNESNGASLADWLFNTSFSDTQDNANGYSQLTFYLQLKNYNDFDIKVNLALGKKNSSAQDAEIEVEQYCSVGELETALWNSTTVKTAMASKNFAHAYSQRSDASQYATCIVEPTLSGLTFAGMAQQGTVDVLYGGNNYTINNYTNAGNALTLKAGGIACLKINFAINKAFSQGLSETRINSFNTEYLFDIRLTNAAYAG